MSPQLEEFLSLLLIRDDRGGDYDLARYKSGFRSFLSASGIEFFNYGAFYMKNGKPSKAYFADSNFCEAWLEEYLTCHYGGDDYVLGRAKNLNGKQTDSFLLGEWLAPYIKNKSVGTAHILRGAGDAGMRDGIGIVGQAAPPDRQGRINWGFGLGGAPGTGRYAMGKISEITIAAAMLMDRLMPEIEGGINRKFKPLTSREKDVLGCFAAGLQRDRTAERLNISAVTVDYHSRNARKKLGAATLAESIARAFRYGQL